MNRLEGRRALVTGASSGIGEAYARALRARGCPLVLVARREERLRTLASELGGDVQVVPADLASPGGPRQVYDEVQARGLAVDVLVNNAGVGHTGRFEQEPPAAVENILDLNARAAMLLTRLFLPAMVERRQGIVVNVVSTSAFQIEAPAPQRSWLRRVSASRITGVKSRTKTPAPLRAEATPSLVSTPSAWRAVMRAMP